MTIRHMYKPGEFDRVPFCGAKSTNVGLFLSATTCKRCIRRCVSLGVMDDVGWSVWVWLGRPSRGPYQHAPLPRSKRAR